MKLKLMNSLTSLRILFFLFVFGTGCAAHKPQVKDEVVKLEAPDTIVQKESVMKIEKGVPGGDVDTPQPVLTPEKPLTPEASAELSAPGTKLEPAKPFPALSDKQEAGDLSKTDEEEGQIVFNFDNADLYEVIRTLAELLEINYIVESSVKGKVTIHTAGGLRKKDLFPIFLQILEANGITAIKAGNLYKIVPLKEASRMPIISRLGREGEAVSPAEKVIIQIIPLKFISAQEMTKLLAPFISTTGTVISEVNSNTLLVVDKGFNILKAIRLVEAFDVNMFERVNYRFFILENVDVEEVVTILGEMFSSYSTAFKGDLKFIAISRLNALLAISSNPLVFGKAAELVRQLDVEMEDVEPRIYVYFVKNGEAEQLAGLLKDVFVKGKKDTSKTKKKSRTQPSATRNPLSRKAKREKAAAKTARKKSPAKSVTIKKGGEGGSGTLKGEVNITPDEVRNALIIEATPSDYKVVIEMLRQIDTMPRQVLIEAIIAEISLTDEFELGLDWKLGVGAAIDSATGAHIGDWAATINNAAAKYNGLIYSKGSRDKWYGILEALASDNRLTILSSPHILASDNIEAKIDVSREIPVISTSYNNSNNTNTVYQHDVEYRDTGIILTVTPHINDRGLVTMDIAQEVSELEANALSVGGQDYQVILKRNVNTTLTVAHGQTIVIGGLIRDKNDTLDSGVPWLYEIPLIGPLFGKTKRTTTQVELIILITPRVVANLDDVDAV
ncbi:MAG: type II secretion system secretin GspD, partial [Desulfobacterales bacterium]|nr:type II secretion system secretin GspD [Desulfobacterales bacterium]